jgi:hypothetical protein
MGQLCRMAAGLWRCEIVRLDSEPRFENQRVIASWIGALIVGDHAPLCMSCDTEFKFRNAPPAAFMLLFPFRDNPEIGSATGICERCAARSDDELMEAALAFVRGSLLPDARRLEPGNFHATGGRA